MELAKVGLTRPWASESDCGNFLQLGYNGSKGILNRFGLLTQRRVIIQEPVGIGFGDVELVESTTVFTNIARFCGPCVDVPIIRKCLHVLICYPARTMSSLLGCSYLIPPPCHASIYLSP